MFESIEEIRTEFGLSDEEPLEIRNKLRKLLAKAHPDKSGGEFMSAEEKDRYSRLHAAIEFIDGLLEKKDALVPTSTFTELVHLIQDLVPTKEDKKASEVAIAEARFSTQVLERMDSVGRQHMIPKITVSTVSIILTALWTFPSAVLDHPVLSQYISVQNPYFTNLWLYSLLAAGLIWYTLLVGEDRQRQFISKLKTESVQNRLFTGFTERLGFKERLFSKDDFIEFLLDYYDHPRARTIFLPFSMFFRRNYIDVELAQNLADLVFSRAEAKGIIMKIAQPSLTDSYRFVQQSVIER